MFQERLIGLLLGAALWVTPAGASEQSPPIIEITFEEALSLARERAPALLAARARIGEAEGRVEAAAVRRFNPELEGSAGPRFSSGDTGASWSVGAQQWLEVGGQRGDRMEAAHAGVLASRARSEDARRLLLLEVSQAFVTALYWDRRIALAEEHLRLAEAIEGVATRRHEVGDVGGLEESVASLFVLRTRSDLDRAHAARIRTRGRLHALLGLEVSAELRPRGDLRQLGIRPETRADLSERPDLQALRADLREAEAEARLGRAGRIPDLALGASYSREESANIVQGTLTLTLPVFDHGQGSTAVALARRDRLQAELRAASSAAAIEARTAEAAALRLGGAAHRYDEGGLATLERARRLAVESYEAGAIPLGELLSIQRELVQAKLDHAGLLLAAATAWSEVAALTGSR